MLTVARAAPAPDAVGYQHTHMPDGAEIGIWYPARGAPSLQRLGIWEQHPVADAEPVGHGLPLVVVSHGTGGSFAGHLDTAAVLASHGFVVAAVTHPGDNWQDQSRTLDIQNRPRELIALLDFMLGGWRSHAVIDPGRVGAFGFSAGGFTVLAAAGGRPDWHGKTASHHWQHSLQNA